MVTQMEVTHSHSRVQLENLNRIHRPINHGLATPRYR